MRKEWQYLYKQARWRKLRLVQLSQHPSCEHHMQIGIIKSANVVDHKQPHKGNEGLFYDESNLQSLCKECHDKHKQSQERTGILKGGDVKGTPLDQSHHWNS